MKPTLHFSPSGEATGGDPTDPEAILRVVLEKSPLLVYVANLDFKVVLANRTLREVTGYDTSDCPTVEALIGTFYPHGEAYTQRVRDIHQGWKRNEHIMGAKLLVQCKDGTQRTVAWYTSRLRIGRGPTVGYVAMGLDLSTQGTLEQWVGLLQRTLEHLDEGVILTDPNGAILAWNKGASHLLGHGDQEMQGAPLSTLFAEPQRAAIASEIDEAVCGELGQFEDELELLRKNGSQRTLRFTQVRLDGEGGSPLARLTVLAPADSEGADLLARAATLQAQLDALQDERAQLVESESSLRAKLSTLDAELATSEAAAGQIADLRGQLELAEQEVEAQGKTIEELKRTLAAEAVGKASAKDSVATELGEAQSKLAEAVSAQEAAEQARAEADEARAVLANKLDEIEAARTGALGEIDSARGEVKAAQEELALLKEALAAAKVELAGAHQALEDAEEGWVQERSKRDEQHRAEMEALQEKAAEQRSALEAQLHKDILAAEERAELERGKLLQHFKSEKQDLSQAAEIAQAEIEARAGREVEELRAQLSSRPSLASYLGALPHAAVVCADTTGAVLAWSPGAEALDGRSAEQALGKVIFDEVLSLEGIKWKALFGQVAIRGAVEQDVLVEAAGGAQRPVTLHARMVKDNSGAPVGLCVALAERRAAGEPSLHLEAALGRLVAPLRARALSLSTEGLASARDARVGAEPLVALGKQVQGGIGVAEALTLARKEHLGAAAEAVGGSLLRAEDAWKELALAVADLDALASVPDGGGMALDLLLSRTGGALGLHTAGWALDCARPLGAGQAGALPLIVGLLEGQTPAVQSRDPGVVTFTASTWDEPTRQRLLWLAAETGIVLRFEDDGAVLDLVGAPLVEGDDSTVLMNSPSPVPTLAADDPDELELEMEMELDEPDTRLDMAGADELELEAEEATEDEAGPSLQSGRVRLREADDDDLMVYAGEDSVIKSADVVYMKVNSLAEVDPVLRSGEQMLARKGGNSPISQELPPLDELDELVNDGGSVSADLLHTAGDMDAYAAARGQRDDDLDDVGERRPPSDALLAEMRATDGDGMKSVPTGAEDGSSSRKRRKGRKRKT